MTQQLLAPAAGQQRSFRGVPHNSHAQSNEGGRITTRQELSKGRPFVLHELHLTWLWGSSQHQRGSLAMCRPSKGKVLLVWLTPICYDGAWATCVLRSMPSLLLNKIERLPTSASKADLWPSYTFFIEPTSAVLGFSGSLQPVQCKRWTEQG